MDRYNCNTCNHRFADRPGFEGRHYTEDVMLYAIRLVARNMLPKDVAETIKDEKGIVVSGIPYRGGWTNIRGWWRHLQGSGMQGGNAVSVDEKHYKSKGKARWMPGPYVWQPVSYWPATTGQTS